MYDFGVITPWQPVSHTFRIRNPAEAPLQITEVLPSCSCTTAAVEKRPVPAGGLLDLTVTLDPTDLSGVVERTVTLRAANDALTVLRLRASVLEPFHLSRRSITFDHAESNASTQEIEIEPAIRIVNVEAEGPVTVHAANERGSTRLEIQLRNEQLPAARRGVAFVRITTDGMSTPVPIRVSWERSPVFRIAPGQVVLGGDERNGKVTIESLDRSDFHITRVANADKRLFVRSLRHQTGRATITIHLRSGRGTRLNDTLVISTDRIEEPELRVSVLALIP